MFSPFSVFMYSPNKGNVIFSTQKMNPQVINDVGD